MITCLRDTIEQLHRVHDGTVADEAVADVRRGLATDQRAVGQQRYVAGAGLADHDDGAR